MVTEKLQIKNASGLHMRPAGIFVKEVQGFKSEVLFTFKGSEYNAKSMINVLSAAVKCGDEIELIINGEDENDCLAAIKAVVENGLGE